jgi:predicted dehydrogenase
MKANRRNFIRRSLTAAAGIISTAPLAASAHVLHQRPAIYTEKHLSPNPKSLAPIRFSVIGLNHGHIYGQCEAVIRNGGQLVSFYAKEPELTAAFTKRYPDAKLARSEKEILEDNSIQLIISASIPLDRAPLGIQVMRHGKDFMVDKPGIVTLEQLAEVKKVQKETKRIYSIMYSERFENRATVKAGELVKAVYLFWGEFHYNITLRFHIRDRFL